MKYTHIFVIALSLILMFTLIFSSAPSVFAAELPNNDLPDVLYDFPTMNYSTDDYLLLKQGNNFWLLHFEDTQNVYVDMLTTKQVSIGNSHFDMFVYDTTKDTTWRLYTQSNSNKSYTIGSQSYNYNIVYSSFDVLTPSGEVYYKSDADSPIVSLTKNSSSLTFKILSDLFDFITSNPIVIFSILVSFVLIILFTSFKFTNLR